MHDSQSLHQIPIDRMSTSQKKVPSSVGWAQKQRAQRQGPMLVGDRVPLKSRIASTQGRRVNETKDFIALNRNLSKTRLRVPTKSNDVEAERRFCTGKNDSVSTQRSPVRKKRTLNAYKPVDDNSLASSSLLEKPRTNKGNIVISNGPCKITDIVSFTFNSPIESTTRINEVNMNAIKKEKQSYLQMNGDDLSAILEQKLKELSHQVETEAKTGCTPSARTTASILQDLISALTSESPEPYEDESKENDIRDSECDCEVADNVSQAKLRSKISTDGYSRDVDHSPGCVLDASFCNDSCISRSIDDISVQPATSTDSDLLDSATSTNKLVHGVIMVTTLVNHTTAVLQNIKRVYSKLSSTKLNYIQETILNAELLFGDISHSPSRFLDFLFGPFLDELESLVVAAWKNSLILGIEVRKEENPLRRFLLDCLIECLDVKYTSYSNSGFNAWSKLPQNIYAEILLNTFDEEVRNWISFSGKSSDEIIEWEMSTSFGKWTDFEIEEFEMGAEISHGIVQFLVDEIITDLHSC